MLKEEDDEARVGLKVRGVQDLMDRGSLASTLAIQPEPIHATEPAQNKLV